MQKVVDNRETLADRSQEILARDIGWRVRKYEKLLVKLYKPLYEQLRLSFSETTVLLAIARDGGARDTFAADIARAYGIERSVISRALKYLCAQGLVVRTLEISGSRHRLALTDAGYRAVDVIVQQWGELQHDIASLYGVYEVESLDRLLTKAEKKFL